MGTSTPADIFELILKRDTATYKAFLGFSALPISFLLSAKEQYLHTDEIAMYESIQADRRRKSFLQGRYITKKVLSPYLNEQNLANIRIKSGVFNQPLVVYAGENSALISIAHTDAYAACLAFPDEHPMGIDLEQVNTRAREDILSQMTVHEQKLNRGEEEDIFYTRLWSVKESLSKVLKTGLLVPLQILEIDSMETHAGYTISTFTNFAQYKALSFLRKGHICSITLPQRTSCDLSSVIPG
jgi:4'-phosphopantetheinyl transferase